MLYHALSCYPDARKHIDMLHQRRGKDFNMIALIGARKNINPTHTHDERRPRRTTEKRICLRFWRSKLCYTTLSEAHAPRPTRCPDQQRYPDLPYPTLPYPRISYTYPTLPYPTLLMFWPLRGPPTIKQRSAVAPPFSRPRVAFFLLPGRSYPTLPYPGVGREPLPYPDLPCPSLPYPWPLRGSPYPKHHWLVAPLFFPTQGCVFLASWTLLPYPTLPWGWKRTPTLP